MSNILILNGSPRLNGNTMAMIESFKKGIQKNCNHFSAYNLAFMNVHDSVVNDNEMIKDDMEGIYKSLRESQYVVFASPLYFYSFSGYLKNAIDRLSNVKEIEDKKLIVFVSMGSSDVSSLEPLKEQCRLIAKHLKWELISFLYLPECIKPSDYQKHIAELEKPFQLGLSIE